MPEPLAAYACMHALRRRRPQRRRARTRDGLQEDTAPQPLRLGHGALAVARGQVERAADELDEGKADALVGLGEERARRKGGDRQGLSG
jgi:hypothetical protein